MVALFTIFTFTFVIPPEVRYRLEAAQGHAEGRREAERDITANTMKLKIYGYMAGLDWWHETYVRRMRDRLGVEIEVVAQCTMTSREYGLWSGYNERIEEELDRQHGPGVLARVQREATTQWQLRRVLEVAIAVFAFVRVVRWFIKRPPTEVVS